MPGEPVDRLGSSVTCTVCMHPRTHVYTRVKRGKMKPNFQMELGRKCELLIFISFLSVINDFFYFFVCWWFFKLSFCHALCFTRRRSALQPNLRRLISSFRIVYFIFYINGSMYILCNIPYSVPGYVYVRSIRMARTPYSLFTDRILKIDKLYQINRRNLAPPQPQKRKENKTNMLRP